MSYGHGSVCFCDECCAKRNAGNAEYNRVYAAGKRYGENDYDFQTRITKAARKAAANAKPKNS